MTEIETHASLNIHASVHEVFSAASSIAPSTLIQSYGPLPGIVSGDGHDAPWSTIGQTRIHTLSDGGSVNEKLIAFEKDNYYAYEVSGFTGPFALLVSGAQGVWTFVNIGDDRTHIDWTYKFFPRNVLAAPIVWLIAKTLWPGYLKSALERVKRKTENGS